MALDIIALTFSAIALLISGLSYFGTRATKRREWRIEAKKVVAEVSLSLSKVAKRAQYTRVRMH